MEIVEPKPGRFTHHLELDFTAHIAPLVYDCLQKAWTDAV